MANVWISAAHVPAAVCPRAADRLRPPVDGITAALAGVHPTARFSLFQSTVTPNPDGSAIVSVSATHDGAAALPNDPAIVRALMGRLNKATAHVCAVDRTPTTRWVRCDNESCPGGCLGHRGWYTLKCCGIDHLPTAVIGAIEWKCAACAG